MPSLVVAKFQNFVWYLYFIHVKPSLCIHAYVITVLAYPPFTGMPLLLIDEKTDRIPICIGLHALHIWIPPRAIVSGLKAEASVHHVLSSG